MYVYWLYLVGAISLFVGTLVQEPVFVLWGSFFFIVGTALVLIDNYYGK